MLERILSFLQGTPLTVLLLGAHFLLYSLIAWPVLIGRVVCGRFSQRETALFAFFAGFILLEWLQLFVDGSHFRGQDVWGLPRYFGAFAPILWIWVAKALAWLWTVPRQRMVRGAVRLAIAASLGWVFVAQGVLALADAYLSGARADAEIVADAASEIILADYAGPSRQGDPKRSRGEYFTSRRPVVFSDFAGLAAWKVRGQSESPTPKACPYQPDYVLRRASADPKDGTASINLKNRRNFDFMTTIRGLRGLGPEFDPDGEGCVWFLFRRKGVPFREK